MILTSRSNWAKDSRTLSINRPIEVVVLNCWVRTNDPHRVLLRLSRKYESAILLEGIVDRTTLASSLKAELIRFFTAEFDPQHWDMGRDPEPEGDYIQVKDVVLSDPWLALSKR